MEEFSYDFLVVGGDMRMKYLAEFLCQSGFSVITYGLVADADGCIKAEHLTVAIDAAAAVVGPVPFSKDHREIYHHSNCSDLQLNLLLQHLKAGHWVFGACFSEQQEMTMRSRKVTFFDFMKEDSVAVLNSIATAEGMIAHAIIESAENLNDSNALVMGYGRCAQTLAEKLKYLTNRTAICARSSKQIARAGSMGLKTVAYDHLKEQIGQYQLIFNTVPALVLDREVLAHLSSDARVFDIASAPGGVDFAYAAENGISARLYPGIPAKYAPKTSGKILADCIIEKIGKK